MCLCKVVILQIETDINHEEQNENLKKSGKTGRMVSSTTTKMAKVVRTFKITHKRAIEAITMLSMGNPGILLYIFSILGQTHEQYRCGIA